MYVRKVYLQHRSHILFSALILSSTYNVSRYIFNKLSIGRDDVFIEKFENRCHP